MGKAVIEHYFGSKEPAFILSTANLKHVSEYTGLSFREIDNLLYAEYKVYLVESWIYTQMQTEEGREFLNRLKELQITNIDIESLRGVATFE